MNIQFNDSLIEMKRRWIDIQKMNQSVFFDIYYFIDNFSDFSREELLQLQELINEKTDNQNLAPSASAIQIPMSSL